MARDYVEAEIALRYVAEAGGLDVGLRFVLSDDNVDRWVHSTDLLHLDLADLAAKANRPPDYGEALTTALFGRPDVAEFYTGCQAAAGSRPVHLRLNLDAPPAIHRVCWELLNDPKSGLPLAVTENVLFSRYLISPDFRPIAWRTKQATRALVVIAAPTGLDRYGGGALADVDLPVERELAGTALAGMEIVYLAGVRISN